MPFLALEIPPGVVRVGSPAESDGRWRDANLVRWHQGRLRPVGGWYAETAAMTGSPRSMHTWSTNAGYAQMIIGTNNRLYQWTGGTALTEISDSLTSTGSIGPDSMTTSGTTLTYSGGGFNALFSDDVRFKITGGSNAGVHTISNVDSDTQITVSSAFGTNENTSLTLDYLWKTGRVEGQANTGFGAGTYDSGNYDEDQTDASLVTQAGRWTFDTWGEDILAVFRQDGQLFYWDVTGGTYPLNGALVANAPTGNLGVVVTQERIAMLYGAGGNTRKIQWSDQEDYTTWAVTATGEAGSFVLQTTGDIQTTLKVRDAVLVLTDEDAHEITYQGQPFIYGRRRISDTAGVVGPDAVAVIEFAAYWMGRGGFYRYNGGYIEPLACDVLDYVFHDIASRADRVKYSQVTASENRQFNEVWWFYASAAGSGENDRYVCYNYRDNWWSVGSLDRLAWDENNPWGAPFAVGSDYKLYRMEQSRDGNTARLDSVSDPGSGNYGSNTRNMAWGGASSSDSHDVYAETGDIRVSDGSRRIYVAQVITDAEKGDTSALRMRFYTAETPVNDTTDDAEIDQGAVSLNADGYSDCRFSGRHLRYRIEAPFDQDFRVGEMRLDATSGGNR